MSKEVFEDGDPGNAPAFVDVAIGKIIPLDSPIMKAVVAAWEQETTLDERRAWYAVTCLNSRRPDDLKLALQVSAKLEAACSRTN